MAKKKCNSKSKSCNKKSCGKKCNRVESQEKNIDNEIPPKTNQFLGLIKRVFGYE